MRTVIQGLGGLEVPLTDLSILVADRVTARRPIAAAGLDVEAGALAGGLKLGEGLGCFVGIGDVLDSRASGPDSDPYSSLRLQSASAARRGDRSCAEKGNRAGI